MLGVGATYGHRGLCTAADLISFSDTGVSPFSGSSLKTSSVKFGIWYLQSSIIIMFFFSFWGSIDLCIGFPSLQGPTECVALSSLRVMEHALALEGRQLN